MGKKKFNTTAEAYAAAAKGTPLNGKIAIPRLWVRLLAAKYPDGDFIPALTQREAGQLKQLDTRSEGRGEQIVRWVIPNWLEFVTAVKSEMGWKDVPSKPSIGFLLQNVSIAANMSAPKKPAKKYETPKPVIVPQPVQLISPAKEPQATKLTMAEILATLDE